MIRDSILLAVIGMAATGLFGINIANGVEPLTAKLLGQLHPSGLPAGVPFGGGGNSSERRVDVSGSLAVVGAGLFNQAGNQQGHAFVYDFSDETDIRQIATLRASDDSNENQFGEGVAISGNFVFVSARGDSTYGGAVYMYDVSDPNNIVERKITPYDAAPQNQFGSSLAVDGSRLIVGAPKPAASTLPTAVYVVDFSDPDNLQQRKILGPSYLNDKGFGYSIDISDDHVIVGMRSDSTEFPFGGSASIYDISNLDSIVEQRLIPTDAPNYQSFGSRVSVSGTKALVSVASDPGPGNPAGASEGTVWAFDFSDWNNIKQNEYGRSSFGTGSIDAPFGRWLELEGNIAVEGAFNEDSTRGAVYLHNVSNVQSPTELLRVPAPSFGDSRFGISFALDGSTLLVSDNAGQVYLYRLVPEPTSGGLIVPLLACLLGGARNTRRLKSPSDFDRQLLVIS